VYINDLDNSIKRLLLKIADGTKVLRKNYSEVDNKQLQKDLYTLPKWPQDWQMTFNRKTTK